ncbi:MAG: diaminopimelate decarboxylase [Phycisphaerae bacterium]|nr:diaminopimelate decarboxylase [Phycisphaerae bacterium]
MDSFTYKDGSLMVEGVPASGIAAAVQTPCFVYSAGTITSQFQRIQQAFEPLHPNICFALKSCSNIGICKLLGSLGAGMDLVSAGELHRSVAAGIDPSRCVFAGVGKTDSEIRLALEHGVGLFNIESEQEFQAISRIASSMGVTADAALRVNPEVEPGSHEFNATGRAETKFGVALSDAVDLFGRHGDAQGCRLRGLHMHIGSQIHDTTPYATAIGRVLEMMDLLESRGHAIDVLDVGGGFGVDYITGESIGPEAFAEVIVPMLRPRVDAGLRLYMEPGRSIVANAGILLTKVIYTKQSGSIEFAICDAGMNTLLRPCHYDAFHFIWPTDPGPGMVPQQRTHDPDLPGLRTIDVVGPICETGDYLARRRPLPPIEPGQLLAVFGAGAYGMSMSSRYNSQPLPAEVLVDEDSVGLIRRRESFDDLLEHELLNPSPVHLPMVSS